MKIAVIGIGRMGQRHIQGALLVDNVQSIIAVDINQTALDNAQNNLKSEPNFNKIDFKLSSDFYKANLPLDVIIVASTAGDRIEDLNKLLKLNPKCILLEKPLGQSMHEVEEIIKATENQTVKVYVNLNTRLYPSFNKLKNDILTLPQFNGITDVSVTTGTLGIGANGIHYIDLMSYLFNADEIEFVAGEISTEIVPSGRGSQFCDFGGWCVLNYKSENKIKAKVHFSISSQSTSLGTMNFTFPHARVIVDEFEQIRYNKYRKEDSTMPLQRYAADYQTQETEEFISPDLKLLTKLWLQNLSQDKEVLPLVKHSLLSHKTMFEWLSKSATHKNIFPIT